MHRSDPGFGRGAWADMRKAPIRFIGGHRVFITAGDSPQGAPLEFDGRVALLAAPGVGRRRAGIYRALSSPCPALTWPPNTTSNAALVLGPKGDLEIWRFAKPRTGARAVVEPLNAN